MYNWYNFQPKILKEKKTPVKSLLGEALVPFLIIFFLAIWSF